MATTMRALATRVVAPPSSSSASSRRRRAVVARRARRVDAAPIAVVASSAASDAPEADASVPEVSTSRRVALTAAASSPFLQSLASFLAASAASVATAAPALAAPAASAKITSKVFFDFAVDAVPAGRVVFGVYGDGPNPISAARFLTLARGLNGLGYKRTQIDAIEYAEEGGADVPLFVGDCGVRAFVIPGSTTPVEGLPGGNSAEGLLPELSAKALSHDRRGVVSLIVERGSPPPPPKEKLVSMNGKFVTVTDPPPPGPNGTAFTVTVASGADELSEVAEILDRTNVVVGEVVEGMEVLDAIAALPTVKDNSSSPFFAVAKTIGDKRATVAEQAFGKPFAKVTVSKSWVVEDAPPVEAAVGVESAEVASS